MNKKNFLVFFLILLSIPFVNAQNFGSIVVSNVISFTINACESYGSFLRYIVGAECSISIAFLILLVLWIFIVMVFFDIIATYSPFSRGTSFIISLGLYVIIANFGFVGAIVEWISDFIAGGGALKLIAFLLAVLIIYILIKTITEAEKKRRRKEEVKESEERVMKISKVFGEGEK